MSITKQNIIDTAFALFREKSYDRVTVNDICAACSITKTTFYYHLNSKGDILSSFYDSVIKDMSSRLLDVFNADNYWERLMACFDMLIDTSGNIGAELYAQMYIVNLKEDRGTFNFNENLTKLAVLLIERAQKAGQIRNQSPARPLYRAAAHTFEGYDLLWCIKDGNFDRKPVIRRAMEDIFDVNPEYRIYPINADDSVYYTQS